MLRILLTTLLVCTFLPIAQSNGRAAAAGTVQPEVKRRLEALNHFSKCLATRRADLADGVLGLPLESPEQAVGIRKMLKILGGQLIQSDTCLRAKSMRIKYLPVLVGGMAEARVLGSRALADADLLSRSASLVAGRNSAESFALCLVKRRAGAAAGLIRTTPASSSEQRLTGELRADLGACPFGRGSFAGDDFALRTYAAVGLYLAINGIREAQPVS